jgi:hypothetical protein
MSNQEIDKEMEELLKQAVAPVQDTELRRDLWPQMLRKLEEPPLPTHNVPWFDWALASLAAAALLFFPGLIPALFYHL